uniref:ATP synthase complex subunit 8 n=1 Tax=Sycanus bifidus TaxID=452395 RepID=A0A7L8XKB8_9HEMI|nr:ATP synthase F0 subunit 8 [Sycanus croceovittatus]QOH97844.1 ATP synthase F0 subunit 8 [Sycanus croceovittatus]
MPQMAPIWWTTLFIMFNLSFLAMITITYFQEIPLPSMESKTIKQIKNLDWKW